MASFPAKISSLLAVSVRLPARLSHILFVAPDAIWPDTRRPIVPIWALIVCLQAPKRPSRKHCRAPSKCAQPTQSHSNNVARVAAANSKSCKQQWRSLAQLLNVPTVAPTPVLHPAPQGHPQLVHPNVRYSGQVGPRLVRDLPNAWWTAEPMLAQSRPKLGAQSRHKVLGPESTQTPSTSKW